MILVPLLGRMRRETYGYTAVLRPRKLLTVKRDCGLLTLQLYGLLMRCLIQGITVMMDKAKRAMISKSQLATYEQTLTVPWEFLCLVSQMRYLIMRKYRTDRFETMLRPCD